MSIEDAIEGEQWRGSFIAGFAVWQINENSMATLLYYQDEYGCQSRPEDPYASSLADLMALDLEWQCVPQKKRSV